MITMKLRDFSGPGAGKPCVFPFKFLDEMPDGAYGCIVTLWLYGDQVLTN